MVDAMPTGRATVRAQIAAGLSHTRQVVSVGRGVGGDTLSTGRRGPGVSLWRVSQSNVTTTLISMSVFVYHTYQRKGTNKVG